MNRRILFLTTVPFVVGAFAAAGCLSEGGVAPGSTNTDGGSTPIADGGFTTPDATVDLDPDAGEDDPTTNDAIKDSTQPFLTYRDDLSTHPGCTTADLGSRSDGALQALPAYTSADLPGFPCAAREFNVPLNEDLTRPVIILVHGNSSSPFEWENNPTLDGNADVKMLAPTLADDGWHVYEADLRIDKAKSTTPPNGAGNVDHGWATPLVEALIKAVHAKYPNRKINMGGFSLGPTVIRDALRRMHHRGEKPFSYMHALHFVSAANHGVRTFTAACGDINAPNSQSMVGWAACQLGNRTGYTPVPFLATLNGPDGAYETPCADGIHAYGQTNVCGRNIVLYTTTVHKDEPDGTTKDEFVSEASAALKGADNRTVTSLKATNFFGGPDLFANHYGAIRSAEGVALAKSALER